MISFRPLATSAFALILLLTAGCFGSTDAPPPDTEVVRKELLEKNWICQSILERDVRGDVELTVTFLADGTVKGHAGCNDFSGTYDLDGEKLTFGPFAVTKKACSPATMEQEFTYLSYMARVTQLKVDGSDLELFVDNNPTPMAFSTSGGGFLW